jgi:hypothetical protein
MEMVERVARAICASKSINPDCLCQHNFDGDWPEDDRRDYHDPFTGKPRTMLFHRAWRHYEKGAVAAIEAMREPTHAMDRAAFDVCEIGPGVGAFETNTHSRRAIYGAMIDAALPPLPTVSV